VHYICISTRIIFQITSCAYEKNFAASNVKFPRIPYSSFPAELPAGPFPWILI